jgi:hypothetical protein
VKNKLNKIGLIRKRQLAKLTEKPDGELIFQMLNNVYPVV